MKSNNFLDEMATFKDVENEEKIIFKQLNELKIENNRLSKLYLDLCDENDKLRRALKEKVITLSSRKSLVLRAIKKYAVSIRNACKMFSISRTAYYYQAQNNKQDIIEIRLLQLAKEHPTFGYWKLYYLLRDEGYTVNHKRVYRLYKLLRLKDRNYNK